MSLIGREKELAILKSRVDKASQGKGGLVFIKGEAGVGKTRLLIELKSYCNIVGVTFLQGKCYSPEIAYSPFTEAINDYIRRTDPKMLKALVQGPAVEIAALVPTLQSIIGAQEREVGLRDWLRGPKPTFHEKPISALATALEDESGRLAFFEGMTQFLINISKQKPLVMCLEDLHRADRVTPQLLRYITRHIFDQRILMIGSFREEELDPSHPLSQLILDLEKEALCQTLALETLSKESILQIMRSTISDFALSQQVVDTVYPITRGNPYFALETFRLLSEQGAIGRDFVDPIKLRGTMLPSTVKALMNQRLERLDPECRELLSVSSVIGLEFDYELLSQVVEGPEEETLKNLETALKAGLLQEKRYRTLYRLAFTDPRIHGILLESLSTIRRRKLHEKIGQIMEKICSENLSECLAEIAYHYVEAGNAQKAIHYSMMAGERAASIHAYDEAIRHYRCVVELAEGDEERSQAEQRIVSLQESIENWNEMLGKMADLQAAHGYNRIADLYEANIVPLFGPLARRVVEMARLREGQTVLDIGTGTGLAAFFAAELVGQRGSVLGIDFSEGMLSCAKRKSQNLHFRNIEFKKMDEISLNIEDNSFDAVIANLGLPAFNADRAFKEMYRVLKPGGILVFNEWTEKESKLESTFMEILMKYGTRSPSELLVAFREARTYRVGGFSRLTNRAALERMLRDAGFKEVSSTTTHYEAVYHTIEEFISYEQSWWTIPFEITEMDPENRKEFMDEVKRALATLLSPLGLVEDWELNYFSASK